MPKTSPIVIVLNADDKFAMPLAVTLYSALTNLRSTTSALIYIIDGGIGEQNRQKLTSVLNVKNVAVQLEWVKPDTSVLNGLKTTRWFNETIYFRLLVPQLLPLQLEKVLYLDSDLVVESDLGQLWSEEIGDYAALAVQDYGSPFVSCPHALSETYQLLGLAPETPYCNTGVMAINLKWWRAENIGSKVLDYVRQFDHFIRYPDQDGLNAIVAGKWKLLDPKWNVMLSTLKSYGCLQNISKVEIQQMQEELCRRPFILHFTGQIKPWHFLYSKQARSRFFYYLQKSQWFGAIEAIDELMKTAWQHQNQYDKLMEQLYMAKQELDELIPPAETFILVNEDQWFPAFTKDWYAIPFLERDGQYWGAPPDDETAIREFERLRGAGAKFMVFGWPSFWWLDYYCKLSHHLRSLFCCVFQNERLIVFDLRT